MCRFRCFPPLALVGGVWLDRTSCGLWCLALSYASVYYHLYGGARLLILRLGIWCVRFVVVVLFLALVGGASFSALESGLWTWYLIYPSDDHSTVVGARPLILRLGI